MQANIPAALPVILAVDDLEANLEAMRALLEGSEKWQLRCANSGEAALGCLLKEDISLVLLDVQMPGMDGYEVAELMRGSPKTRDIPIIFVSAIARTQELILRGYNSGAVDFILKPFDPAVLRHKVQNLLTLETNRRALQKTTQQLEREQAFNDSILKNAAEGILVVDHHGLIQYNNPAIAQFITAETPTLQGRHFCELIASPTSETNWQQSHIYRHWQQKQVYHLREAALHTNGGTLPVALSCAPLPYPQQAMVIIVRDISVELDLKARLEELIVTDPLTGLLNRRGFHMAVDNVLARARRKGEGFSVIYLDLDGFKRVNDSMGHAAGDELLRYVGRQLKSGLRRYDMLARIGGDEFTILLDGLGNSEDAGRVVEKLLQLVSQNHQIGGEDFSINASAGIACYPQAGQDAESLLLAADMAMYEAKQSGGKRYHFHSPQMTERVHARLRLEQRLRQAVERRHFSLLYQPQFALQSGQLRGFEALLRWTDGNPDGATPAQFIPLLEETHLIHPLGQWVFEESFEHLLMLRQHLGESIVISINVSPLQFAQPQLVETLETLLQRHAIAATQVEIEVTESTLMRDMDVTQRQLSQLRELGVKIALDDFGTGYSSLAYLRHFDIDTLKIDRLFISNMLKSQRDAAVVRTIIDLGHHLDMEIIAEGVETRQEREWLVQQNCTTMQGWLAAPALPLERAVQIPLQLDWERLPLA